MTGWGINSDDARIIATTAVRVARNRDIFLDRVQVRTGLQIEVLEGVEENHLTYLAVCDALGDEMETFSASNALIMEVGGGTTDLMMLRQGRMIAAHSFNIGTLRLEHISPTKTVPSQRMTEYLRNTADVILSILNAEMPLEQINYFVGVGGDIRLVGDYIGTQTQEHFSTIECDAFFEFVNRLQQNRLDQIVEQFGISYNAAEGLTPALVVLCTFLEATSATQIVAPTVGIREGVLLSLAYDRQEPSHPQLYLRAIESAMSLGEKYHFDPNHAIHVAHLSLSLFDQLQSEHVLDARSRMLLEVAAILHDIGKYIQSSGHHKHAQYIIANSEMFGMTRPDIRMVSNIVRYHRKMLPNRLHSSFTSLSRGQRITVMKLAALLRIAEVLDREHRQAVKQVNVDLLDDTATLRCTVRGDIAIERYPLNTFSDLFEEVYGYRLVITT